MLLWLSYLFSFYRTRKERIHSEYQKVVIAHVYWRMQYNTFEVFTCTADLFAFSLLIKNKKTSGAAIGYLMQIFFH